jgi:cell pole-organizing protein PopZ
MAPKRPIALLGKRNDAARDGASAHSDQRTDPSSRQGGDVRLEEALARLSRAGRIPAAPVPPAAAVSGLDAQSEAPAKLRPSLAHGDTLPAAADLEFPKAFGRIGAPQPPDDGARSANGHGPSPVIATLAVERRSVVAPPPPIAADRGVDAALARMRPDILSPVASATTASAFSRLAEALVSRSSAPERSVEEVTRDMLRPLLKSWLDDNLPAIVEQLVRQEIERVARRGGR